MTTGRRLLATIELVPHSEQRYATAGDWWFEDDGTLRVLTSDTGDDDCSMLVAVHELVEALLCRKHEVSEAAVCGFDLVFDRLHGKEDLEPGEDPSSPYFNEHAIADIVERLLAKELDVPWRYHDGKVDALFEEGGPSCDL